MTWRTRGFVSSIPGESVCSDSPLYQPNTDRRASFAPDAVPDLSSSISPVTGKFCGHPLPPLPVHDKPSSPRSFARLHRYASSTLSLSDPLVDVQIS